MRISAVVICFAVLFVVSNAVFANPVSNEQDLPLQQDHGSVCIGFRLDKKTWMDDGDLQISSDLDSQFRIHREIGEETTTILPDGLLAENEALAHVYSECGHMNNEPEIDCEKTPEKCVDCDGDQVPECTGMCYEMFYFVIADLCAPAGKARYAIEQQSKVTQDWYEIMTGTIKIDPPDGICADKAYSVCQEVFWMDLPSDAYNEDNIDDDDSGGCSVSRGDPLLSLLGAMAAIGLVALAVSRRRER
ncbi:MAG: hypothetical protein GX444_00725 [Myxococcales bacterium]|nr:hypothetical protein [Myxococcales bacterium]